MIIAARVHILEKNTQEGIILKFFSASAALLRLLLVGIAKVGLYVGVC